MRALLALEDGRFFEGESFGATGTCVGEVCFNTAMTGYQEELSEIPSNWRSEMPLDEYLKKWNIPGAQGIDTRALTRHLRTRGAMKACLTTEEMSPEEATKKAIKGEGVIGMDYVREVSTSEVYQWDPNDTLSAPWSIAR